MSSRERRLAKPLATEATRREALRRFGDGAVLAAMLAGGHGGHVLAHEGTPEVEGGLEGRYVVIRLRTIRGDRSGDDLAALVREGFVPLVREVPGFVSYVVVWNEETRDWAAIGVFADKAGAEESTRRAADWGSRSGANDFVEGDPVAVEGAIVVAATTEP